jgi:molybdopterin molybdotransferase
MILIALNFVEYLGSYFNKSSMISVEEAKKIIFDQQLKRLQEQVNIDDCLGCKLAEPVLADRDMPPFDRVTMDGIAINFKDFESGIKSWVVVQTQYAGELSTAEISVGQCVEVMTGAVLPNVCDTIIRYEDLEELLLTDGIKQFTLKTETLKCGQNIHVKGSDKKEGEVILKEGQIIGATDIALLATVGKQVVLTYRNPRVVVISTGDELTQIDELPAAYQIRASNHLMIRAALKEIGIKSDVFLMRDDLSQLQAFIEKCLSQYDLIVLTGAVSKGKADFIPAILEKLKVTKLFHGVAQRPAKPFWFGRKEQCLVYALPGNPVSAALCTYVYLLPQIKKMMGIKEVIPYVKVQEEVVFKPSLTYFMQAKVSQNLEGQLIAKPYPGNGSGDLTNLSEVNAFIVLPKDQDRFETSGWYEAYFTRNTIY